MGPGIVEIPSAHPHCQSGPPFSLCWKVGRRGLHPSAGCPWRVRLLALTPPGALFMAVIVSLARVYRVT